MHRRRLGDTLRRLAAQQRRGAGGREGGGRLGHPLCVRRARRRGGAGKAQAEAGLLERQLARRHEVLERRVRPSEPLLKRIERLLQRRLLVARGALPQGAEQA